MDMIEVYIPMNDHEDDEVEEVYGRIEEIIKEEGQGCCKIVMGDWNASVGNGQVGGIVGNYGLGRTDERDFLNFVGIERL
ncbi:hypothetical protein J437_LFUL012754 [Ladona fulva]|uniref:Craniofacial development protein 2-like n=1 Tax=Ladona fulva TaxID=123851 RepID=A0A8K0PBK4_LADFU|nr:hypothetical protein J437_LFUL012754 [Ladona fulva]